MGRQKALYDRTRLNLNILANLGRQLKAFKSMSGWSETRIVEEALFQYLNAREKETKEWTG